ncbi:hypothetical protein LTR97_005867 [Elasticomyces elasticus]|uniref:Uncharacterized protein n=1 Tax=Elasticomyces elasticus TaxID=574655 RepID=A0AAN7W7C3_9PEZI|nr:hypothetical protein LTR97_005867 [Elasticomyces elasticus]
MVFDALIIKLLGKKDIKPEAINTTSERAVPARAPAVRIPPAPTSGKESKNGEDIEIGSAEYVSATAVDSR